MLELLRVNYRPLASLHSVESLSLALVVMACRMVLGAHFLSDVSVGALISVAAFFVIMAMDARTRALEALQQETRE